MTIEEDLIEWRKFGHWDHLAKKARLAAFAIWKLRDDPRLTELASECGPPGESMALALSDSFRRESAIAIELVVKAVIALKLRAAGPHRPQSVCRPPTIYRFYGRRRGFRSCRRKTSTACISSKKPCAGQAGMQRQ